MNAKEIVKRQKRRKKRARYLKKLIGIGMVLMIFLKIVVPKWYHTPIVVLDAGHGGIDPGTIAGEVLEKDINFEVTELLKNKLRKKQVTVLLTREDDTKIELSDRADFANENQADVFVSIHCNSLADDAIVYGVECYSLNDSGEGAALSSCITQEISEISDIPLRGMRTADYRVLRETKMPATLVELGYMSDKNELKKLQDKEYQSMLAEAICDGILTYLKQSEIE